MESTGMVHYRQTLAADAVFVTVTYAGLTMLLPARRLNRITDPRHVYVLADGSLWVSDEATPETVFAVVLGADQAPYRQEN